MQLLFICASSHTRQRASGKLKLGYRWIVLSVRLWRHSSLLAPELESNFTVTK